MRTLTKRIIAATLSVMVALTFMPSITASYAQAAAKKPGKVTGLKATVLQKKKLSPSIKIHIQWNRAKNAKKYHVTIWKKKDGYDYFDKTKKGFYVPEKKKYIVRKYIGYKTYKKPTWCYPMGNGDTVIIKIYAVNGKKKGKTTTLKFRGRLKSKDKLHNLICSPKTKLSQILPQKNHIYAKGLERHIPGTIYPKYEHLSFNIPAGDYIITDKYKLFQAKPTLGPYKVNGKIVLKADRKTSVRLWIYTERSVPSKKFNINIRYLKPNKGDYFVKKNLSLEFGSRVPKAEMKNLYEGLDQKFNKGKDVNSKLTKALTAMYNGDVKVIDGQYTLNVLKNREEINYEKLEKIKPNENETYKAWLKRLKVK